jgi:hypothetical protein
MVRQYGRSLDELLTRSGGDLSAAWDYLQALRVDEAARVSPDRIREIRAAS